ncbi:hypothetical protein ACFV10_13365 [Streptomyces cyaneofuscatus]|uniref:hypothetical protein n=1 Tax=Streptomyces cyaneofuscatus TaxID=66883 RepID=UPI003679BE4D
MYLVTALLVRTESPEPAAWTARELARRLRASCTGARTRRPGPDGPRPAHLYAASYLGRTVRAALYMEDSDPLHAELAALDFLLASLAADPGAGAWHLAVLGRPDLHRLPERKGPDPPCHGSTPPCP